MRSGDALQGLPQVPVASHLDRDLMPWIPSPGLLLTGDGCCCLGRLQRAAKAGLAALVVPQRINMPGHAVAAPVDTQLACHTRPCSTAQRAAMQRRPWTAAHIAVQLACGLHRLVERDALFRRSQFMITATPLTRCLRHPLPRDRPTRALRQSVIAVCHVSAVIERAQARVEAGSAMSQHRMPA